MASDKKEYTCADVAREVGVTKRAAQSFYRRNASEIPEPVVHPAGERDVYVRTWDRAGFLKFVKIYNRVRSEKGLDQ